MGKYFTTNNTFIWFRSSMNSHRSLQIVTSSKQFTVVVVGWCLTSASTRGDIADCKTVYSKHHIYIVSL